MGTNFRKYKEEYQDKIIFEDYENVGDRKIKIITAWYWDNDKK